MDLVPRVAGQPLIGALARERDLVAATVDLPSEQNVRGGRSVDDRSLGGADQLRIGGEHVRVADGHDDRRRPDVARDDGGGHALVHPGRSDLHGERGNRLAPHSRSHGGDEAGIDPSAQVRHDGHVRAQPPLDRGEHHALELVNDPLAATLFLPAVGEIHRPVHAPANGGRLAATPEVDRQGVPRLEEFDALEARGRSGHGQEVERLVDAP